MSNHKKQSSNPKIVAMQQRVLGKIAKLKKVNPFLASFLVEIGRDRSLSFRIGYLGIEAFIRTVFEAGLASKMISPEAIDLHPEWFWDLHDQGHKAEDKIDRDRRTVAIDGVYYHLRRRGLIGPQFSQDIRSPYQFLGTKAFQDLLKNDYEHREDVFIVTYARDCHAKMMIVPCSNPVMRDMIITAFRRWPNVWDRSESALRYLLEAEGWFEGTTDGVRSYLDLNAKMLVTAKEHILKRYQNYEERKAALKFLFQIFKVQIEDHPKHRFFADSLFWTNTLVCDNRVPIHLAKRYDIGIYGQIDSIKTQSSGVLLVYKHADLMRSNASRNELYTIDLASIKFKPFWNILAQFALHNSISRIHIPRKFLEWLQKRKLNEENKTHLTKRDMDDYRIHIARVNRDGNARNQKINELTKFITNCVQCGTLTMDDDALEQFHYFPYEYIPKPRPLKKDEIAKVHQSLSQLAIETDSRFRLVDILFSILLLTNIRPGQLCQLTVDGIERNEDGSMTFFSRVKNRGVDKVITNISKYISPLIDEAIELTAKVRETCPVEMENHVFIYENPASASVRFNVYTVTRLNSDLRVAGNRVGVVNMNSGRIRDTYMSFVIKYAAKNGLTDFERCCLTGHAVPNTAKSYSIPDIIDILEFSEIKDI